MHCLELAWCDLGSRHSPGLIHKEQEVRVNIGQYSVARPPLEPPSIRTW